MAKEAKKPAPKAGGRSAKIGSRSGDAKKVFTYKGVAVKPTKFIGIGDSYISAEDDKGNVVVGTSGKPILWSDVVSLSENKE